MTTGRRKWWQLFPRYGNWGAPGYSAGVWNNDPALTDWSVPGIDAMDDLFKWHDWAYQHGFDRDAADHNLVVDLLALQVSGWYARFYRIGAIVVFSTWPLIRGCMEEKMKIFVWIMIALGVILAGSSLMAGEVPPVSVNDFADVPASALSALNAPEAHWIWTVLANAAVAAIASWIFLRIAERLKGTRYCVALTAIKDAVAECYREYVRAVKAASEDGKLTIDEKNEALDRAYRTAVEYARTRGVDILKVFAKETICTLIEKYVRESKSKVVPPPLPDSVP